MTNINTIKESDTNTLISIIEKAGLIWLVTYDKDGKPILKIYEDSIMEHEILKFVII